MTRTPAERLVAVIAHHNRWAAGLLALALVLAVIGVGRATNWNLGELPKDNSLEVWFVDDDPAVEAFRAFERETQLGEPIVVALHDARGVLRPETLALVADLSARLQQLEHVRGVSGLATTLHCSEDDEGTLRAEVLYTGRPTVDEAARVRSTVLADPLLAELVSPDGQTTLLTVQLDSVPDLDRQRASILLSVRSTLEAAVAAAGRSEADWSWGGPGILHQASNAATDAETKRLSGLSALALLLLLTAFYRARVPVLIPLVAVGTATVLLGGVALAMGHAFNLVTAVLPTLVLVVGLIDSVYFVTAFRQERTQLEAEGLSRREIVIRSVGAHVVPGLFNSLTTAVGFLSFLATRMEALRQLGVMAGVGVGLAFLTSLVVCTLALERFDAGYPGPRGAGLDGLLSRIAGWVAQRPRRTLAATAVVALIAGVGTSQLVIDTHTFNAFPADHPVRTHHERIEAGYGPYLPLETMIDTGRAGGGLDPAVLSAVDGLGQELVEDDPRVGSAVSLARVVRRLHEVYVGSPEADRVPDDRAAVEQLLLLYDPARPDDPLAPLADAPTFSHLRLTFRTRLGSTSETAALLRTIERRAAEVLPEGTTLRVAGFGALYTRLNEYLLEGLVTSLLITVSLVFVLVAMLFRSLRYALAAVPANLLPALVVLGCMGLLGIPLDPTNAMIGTLVLCVAVDDTVHLLYRFRASYERSGDPAEAIASTLRVTGRAILISSVAVAGGIGVLAFAEIRTLAFFGGLMALAMLVALVAELVVTPAVLALAFPLRPSAVPHSSPERELELVR